MNSNRLLAAAERKARLTSRWISRYVKIDLTPVWRGLGLINCFSSYQAKLTLNRWITYRT